VTRLAILDRQFVTNPDKQKKPALAGDWKDLGRVDFGRPKGCVGFYECLSGTPPVQAARHAELALAVTNMQPFDPFGA
jgi:hypothetical protein